MKVIHKAYTNVSKFTAISMLNMFLNALNVLKISHLTVD